MKSYVSYARAAKALTDAGYELVRGLQMGSAPFRRGAGYAWIEEDWSPKHQKMRFFVHARG